MERAARVLVPPSLRVPERLNMTPMIDVVFQLIVFFLVSMDFRTLDWKIDASIRGPGLRREFEPPPPPGLDVRLRRPTAASPVELRAGPASLGDAGADAAWDRLLDHARGVRRRAADAGEDPETLHAKVDASPSVPAGTVIRALDVLREAGYADVRFAGTKPPDLVR